MPYPPWPPKWPHRLAIAAVMAFTWCFSIMPLKWLRALGRALGGLSFRLARRRRLIAVDNVAQARAAGFLPEEVNPAETALRSFRLQGQAALEAFRLLHGRLKDFLPEIGFSELDNFHEAWRRARAKGVGLMLITAHTGNWELTGQVLPVLMDFNPTVVGRTQNNPVSDWLIMAIRTSNGNEQIYKHGAGRRMFQALKDGRCLILLVDQAAIVGREGIMAEFMGRPAMTNVIPVRLARRTGAVVLPGFGFWNGTNHQITFYPPFEFSDKAPDDLADDLRRINEPLEDFIKRFPDQWLWGHRRWKTRESVARERETGRKKRLP